MPSAVASEFARRRGWSAVIDVALVAYTFFIIEEIGVEIEGPFGCEENDLPRRKICDTIYQNVYVMADLSDAPQGL